MWSTSTGGGIPAVEDQATDRAFRIGQTRNVQVRKFVCAGTVEEKISTMIREKRGLAAKIVGTGEQLDHRDVHIGASRPVRAGGWGGGRMSGPGGFEQYGKTIRVEGGIKAQSTRGAIGESWWSKRFIGVLESFAMGTRLARGRNYARKGQVLTLDVSPGLVSSSVQGSRPTPYRVKIKITPYDRPTWTRIEQAMAGQALFLARLLAGEMPAQIEEVFAETGSPLFPARSGDLDMSCSCPDWAMPCKHIAATFYLLAEGSTPTRSRFCTGGAEIARPS